MKKTKLGYQGDNETGNCIGKFFRVSKLPLLCFVRKNATATSIKFMLYGYKQREKGEFIVPGHAALHSVIYTPQFTNKYFMILLIPKQFSTYAYKDFHSIEFQGDRSGYHGKLLPRGNAQHIQ